VCTTKPGLFVEMGPGKFLSGMASNMIFQLSLAMFGGMCIMPGIPEVFFMHAIHLEEHY
jgi:hypothetical protein